MRVTGASLHYYNEGANSDKFYRLFYYRRQTDGLWMLVRHWGRDGTAGIKKVTPYISAEAANMVMRRKVAEQVRDGYTCLGVGNFEAVNDDDSELSARLRDWVGTPMLKVPDGFDFVIREEEDIADLLQCSESAAPTPTDSVIA